MGRGIVFPVGGFPGEQDLERRGLGAVGAGQGHGQPLEVPPAGAHPGEGIGPPDVGVAAPGGA